MLVNAIRRVLSGLGAVATAVLLGASALFLLARGDYTFGECVYFAVITVSTVGYGELPDLQRHDGARAVTAGLILLGVCAIAFFQSNMTTLLIEGVIGKTYRRRRMQRKIDALNGHVVIAGCGRTGKHVVEELYQSRHPFVVIDRSEAVMERLNEELGGGVLYVVGDATEDHTLIQAGVERASGVASALMDDRDNLFVTLSARSLNPKARIVSKAIETENEPKLMRAGADTTVSPHRIGGIRVVSELVRPKVTEFLDEMMRVTKKNLRFEEVSLPSGCSFVGRTLREVPIRGKTNLLVVALHNPDNTYVYNPSPDQKLVEGMSLIVMGEPDSVLKLRKMVESR